MPRKKLYLIFLVLSLAGYAWIFINVYWIHSSENAVGVCLFRKVTGFPCLSCGTTHSVLAILKGNFNQALKMNPLGFIVVPVLVIFPGWLLIDLILKKNSFYNSYYVFEKFIGKKWILYPAIILLILNWIIIIWRNF
jgi:hypothetical protein